MSVRMIHPGPRGSVRVLTRRATLQPVAGVLPAGMTVMDAVGALFGAHGCRGGVVSLAGLTCWPMRYVLPAPATDGLHAAWYSDTHAPSGLWRITGATAIVGCRDGAPFLHCHGCWTDGDAATMGHLLPFDSIIAEDASVTGLGATDAWFDALPDVETAFTLLTPQGDGDGPDLFARLCPGQDVVPAIEDTARRHGIADAVLHGVGSIDHVVFADGHRMECHATELRLVHATLRKGRAGIGIVVVDIAGRIARGVLARTGNPVGVTLELIIKRTKDKT